ncbi:hypothetical protein BDR05DRAFT_961579 [Suillus weaverae]|nr:hypothetical protein BDR05DRAFT_961579 [Suillus weaverae]
MIGSSSSGLSRNPATPQSEVSTESTPTSRASEVVSGTVPATSQDSKFWDLINEREGDKCAVTGTLNTRKGPYPPGTQGREGFLPERRTPMRVLLARSN